MTALRIIPFLGRTARLPDGQRRIDACTVDAPDAHQA
jgi:hypothetical protein